LLGQLRQNLGTQDLVSSFMEEDDADKVENIGNTFPFLGRTTAVKTLGKMVRSHFTWWCKALLAEQTGDDWAQLHKPTEVPGFTYIVVGAASGIGKTRFARRGIPALCCISTHVYH